MISGAEIMVKCLEAEGVKVVFGYPGATICPFYDKLYDSDIKHVLVRQEQNAAHAASGYSRCSGLPGVCVATSGPGATNLITGIATAYADSVPMIAITGQVRSDLLGRDVFQEADITGACEPFVKHSYLVSKTEDLPRIFKEAFHIASTGRKGPVLIDIPMDIQQHEIECFEYPDSVNIIGYKPNTRGHAVQVRRAVEAIKKSRRPLIVSGGGVLSSGVKLKFQAFADKTRIPVISTMMGIGVMPSDHEMYLGMLGTHGKPVANRALHDADLVIVCGARLGDRAVAAPDQMSENTTVIHIDIDPAEIGKNVKTEIPIVGDMKNVLNMMIEEIGDYVVPNQWQETVKGWKKSFFRTPPKFDGFVEPRALVARLSSMLRSKAILVADVGQNQIWCANNFMIRDGRFLTTGGMGTMGYSIPASVGVKFALRRRQLPDEHERAGDHRRQQARHQDHHHAQPPPRHGARIAGYALRQAPFGHDPRGRPRLSEARRGLRHRPRRGEFQRGSRGDHQGHGEVGQALHPCLQCLSRHAVDIKGEALCSIHYLFW